MNQDVDKMQVSGPERSEALRMFAEQLVEWDLTMPDVEPLVMDFGKGDFSKIGLIEYWVANASEAGYCGKYLFLFDGQQCPFHSHKHKHETFFVVKGKVCMSVDGQERIMNQGDVLSMPTDKVHSFRGAGNALVLELSSPCRVADNDFRDPEVAAWLKSSVNS